MVNFKIIAGRCSQMHLDGCDMCLHDGKKSCDFKEIKVIGYHYQCPKCGYTYKLYNGGTRPAADYLCPMHKIVMPAATIELGEDSAAPVVITSVRDTGWIPVTDRLPRDGVNPITRDAYVYPVTIDLGGVTDVRYYSFCRGHWYNGPKIMDYMVLAWMERPEPYNLGGAS